MTAKQIDFLLSGYRHPTKDKALAGGKVYTFLDGTSTLSALWTDKDKGGVSDNPIILDSSGKTEVYGDNIYKFRIFDSDNVFVEEITGLEYLSVLHVDIETIADLRETEGSFQNQAVQVLGYTTPGDGGGGPLRIWKTGAAPGTYVDNGGSIIVPDGGDGSEAWLWEYEGVTDVLAWGAKNEVGFNSQPFVQVAIDYCYENQCNLISTGYIEIDDPLTFETPSGVVYWDGSTSLRPPSFSFDVIKCNSTNIALDLIGQVEGVTVNINGLVGPGVTTIQTPGGGAERIGIRFENGQHSVNVKSISDFNINILFDGAFNNIVDIGSCFAAIYGVHSRVGVVSGFNNQNNKIEYGNIGGPFTGAAFPDDAARRLRGLKYGIYMEQGTAFEFTGGALRYIQRDSTSIAIKMDADAHNNKFFCYVEGAREEGYYIDCAGDDNEFYLSEMVSTTEAKDAINITGIGNNIKMLPSRTSTISEAVTAPDTSAGTITINQGNTSIGKNTVQESAVASILKHNLISGVTPTLAGDGSFTTVSTFPQESDGDDSYEITNNGTGTTFFNFAGVSIGAETLRTIQVDTWIKGNTNHAKLGFYILDNATPSIVLNDPITVGVNPSSGWQKVSFKTKIDTPPSGAFIFRISQRNTLASETGCVSLVYPPVVTFNINASNRDTADALPNIDTVKGKLVPEEVNYLRTYSYKVQTVSDLTGSLLSTNGRGIVDITANPSGNPVNNILNMRPNTSVTVVNSSGVSITINSAAGQWTTSFVLAPGESVIIVDVGGLRYINRS